MSEELTTQEQAQLLEYVEKNMGFPQQEEKLGLHAFINKVKDALDNTKVAFMKEEEITAVRNIIRARAYCNVMELDKINDYFLALLQSVAAPTLSRDGFLIQASITQKKESSLQTAERKVNKGWSFGKKNE